MQAMGEDEHCEKNKQLWKRSPVERFFCLGTLLGEKAFFLAAVFAAAWSCRGRRDGRFLPAFSGPPPFPFALFWDTGGRLGIFFLFYHSFAQCVDLFNSSVPAGDHRLWGICGAFVSLFSGNNSGNRRLLFFVEGRAVGNFLISIVIYTGCCSRRWIASAFCSTFLPIFQWLGQGQFFLTGGQLGSEALFSRSFAVLKLCGGDFPAWLFASGGV